MASKARIRQLLEALNRATGNAPSEFRPLGARGTLQSEPYMTRGFAFGINRPGDGKTRYSVEWYDGTGTGCRDMLHAAGWKAFEARVQDFIAGRNWRP